MTVRTYTVGQTARALGVSDMTVRRRAKRGELGARRMGRAWLIDASVVDAELRSTGRRPVPRRSLKVNDALWQVLRARTREFVPDPLAYADVRSRPQVVTELAEARWRDHDVAGGKYEAIIVPKGGLLHRIGARLSLTDEVLFHALVLGVAPAIARHLSTSAHGYRPLPRGDLVEPYQPAWSRWQEFLRSSPDRGKYVLVTDVVAYFEQITRRVLRDVLYAVNAPAEFVVAIDAMLAGWEQWNRFSGLPQGGNAARVLANLYLMSLDESMDSLAQSAPLAYGRWMDDIRVVADDHRLIERAAYRLEESARRLGLNLATGKTYVALAANVARSATDPTLAAIDYDFRLEQYDRVRSRAYPLLRRITNNFRQVPVDRTSELKFALYRLGRSGDVRPISYVLRHGRELAYIADFVFLYLSPFAGRAKVISGVTELLLDADTELDAYLAVHLGRVLAKASSLPPATLSVVRRLAWDARATPALRSTMLRVLGRHAAPADLVELRARLYQESEWPVVRALLAALREADPARARSALVDFRRASPTFSPTVDFLINSGVPPLP